MDTFTPLRNKSRVRISVVLGIVVAVVLIGIALMSAARILWNGGPLSIHRGPGPDSRLITDIDQIALALEMYYNRCHGFPTSLALNAHNGAYGNVVCQSSGSVTLGDFMANIPRDPRGTSYDYAVDPAGQHYVVGTTLELPNSATNSDLDGTVLGIPCDDAPTVRYCKGD